MKLLLPARPQTARRLTGLAVSIPLHALLLMLLIAARMPSPAATMNAERMSTIAAIAVPEPAKADLLLTEEPGSPETGTEQESVRVNGVDIDISKVRARRHVLFPFLTLDLRFLEPLTTERPPTPRKLVSPFAAASPRTRGEPLRISDAALQEAIDRSWSRRERWTAFGEIAALIGAHDPDDGRLPELMRAYLDQNILQPFCDDDIRDPRFWAMLDNAADHADFIDFVRGFAREHPSSRTTTELLFLLDELAQGSRDALLMMLASNPSVDLLHTLRVNREGFGLAVGIREHYGKWLLEHEVDWPRGVAARYDDLRLRLLSTIIESTPEGYRAADARYLAGEIYFKQGHLAEAQRMWLAIVPDAADSYSGVYSRILQELRAAPVLDTAAISHLLQYEYGRWRAFNVDRLQQFGYSCATF
jgi:hypothetical protein